MRHIQKGGAGSACWDSAHRETNNSNPIRADANLSREPPVYGRSVEFRDTCAAARYEPLGIWARMQGEARTGAKQEEREGDGDKDFSCLPTIVDK